MSGPILITRRCGISPSPAGAPVFVVRPVAIVSTPNRAAPVTLQLSHRVAVRNARFVSARVRIRRAAMASAPQSSSRA